MSRAATIPRGDGGAALLLVLLLMTALSVLILESMRTMEVDMVASDIYHKDFQAESLARSGVELAAALLVTDAEEGGGDHYGESWSEYFDRDENATDSLKTGELQVAISDDSGKFPINLLASADLTETKTLQKVLGRMLVGEPFEMEADEAQDLVAAITDWMDKDSEPTGALGAESSFYLAKQPPYSAANGPIHSLEELLMVRGVDEELLYGTGKGDGLRDVLSVWGDTININTAPAAVLAALPEDKLSPGGNNTEMGRDFAEEAIEFRSDEANYEQLAAMSWYRTLPGFADSANIIFPEKYMAVKSDIFLVQAGGTVGDVTRRVYAVLKRGENAGEAGGAEQGEDEKPKVTLLFQEIY